MDTVYEYLPVYSLDASWPDYNDVKIDNYNFEGYWVREQYEITKRMWTFEVNSSEPNIKWKMRADFKNNKARFDFSLKLNDVQQIGSEEKIWETDSSASDW